MRDGDASCGLILMPQALPSERLLDCRLYDSVTGEQLTTVVACDTESGWRRQYIETAPGRWNSSRSSATRCRFIGTRRGSGKQYDVHPDGMQGGSVDVIGKQLLSRMLIAARRARRFVKLNRDIAAARSTAQLLIATSRSIFGTLSQHVAPASWQHLRAEHTTEYPLKPIPGAGARIVTKVRENCCRN
jgi:hypothetical protein